jgi:hypothetical protein
VVDHHQDETDNEKLHKHIEFVGKDSGCTIIGQMIFKKIHWNWTEHPKLKLDMKVLYMIRLVMYIESACYKWALRDKAWTFDNHLFWLKLRKFFNKNGGENIG